MGSWTPLSFCFVFLSPCLHCPSDSCTDKASHYFRLIVWNTKCIGFHQPTSWILLWMHQPELKTLNSPISDQILPILSKLSFPFALSLILSQDFYFSYGNFLYPPSPPRSPSCLATYQLHTPLHRPCSGMSVAHLPVLEPYTLLCILPEIFMGLRWRMPFTFLCWHLAAFFFARSSLHPLLHVSGSFIFYSPPSPPPPGDSSSQFPELTFLLSSSTLLLFQFIIIRSYCVSREIGNSLRARIIS